MYMRKIIEISALLLIIVSISSCKFSRSSNDASDISGDNGGVAVSEISTQAPERTASDVGNVKAERKGSASNQKSNITFDVEGIRLIDMVYVKGGEFTMGATLKQITAAGEDEKPAHKVKLSGFYMSKYEVTQLLWTYVMGGNPSYLIGDNNLPVENVSWDACQSFITKLNDMTGKTFRLPTEAEWEYAARGGQKSKGYKYSGSDDLDEVAWYGEAVSSGSTHAVGTKAPNELGIYDMSGNVWEWCQDWYGSYTSDAQTDPTGVVSGSDRVFRGGSWYSNAQYCRCSNRRSSWPCSRYYDVGLRLVLSE